MTSIIIPHYGDNKLLYDCLAGLAHTISPAEDEVIIVHDGQHNTVRHVVDPIQVTISKNVGFATACNLGARLATHDQIVFLNNDVVVTGEWLEGLRHTHLTRDSLVTGIVLFHESGDVQHSGVELDDNGMPYHLLDLPPKDHPVMAVTGACMMVDRLWFRQRGGFDEGYRNGLEDIDLCLSAPGKVWLCAYPGGTHLVGASGVERHNYDQKNVARFRWRWCREAESDESVSVGA